MTSRNEEQDDDTHIEDNLIDTSSKEEVENADIKKQGRPWTLSIALPASIMLNAQSPELRTYLGGQIARAAAVFNVDEIVVYDEYALSVGNDGDVAFDERKKCVQHLTKILEYLECPQYLRKYLFPIQKDLEYAGLLNPLDCIHHLKSHELSLPYREGIVLNKPIKDKANNGSFIYVGIDNEVQINNILKPNVRVTVKFDPSILTGNDDATEGSATKRRRVKKLKGIAVSPHEPRTNMGLYWGYTVRSAGSLSKVFGECSFKGGYDLLIGTSEKGDNIDDVIEELPASFNHALVVFGGLKGIEAALDSDEKLSQIDNPKDLFQFYLNTCPKQGSNTIRTEEALLITLSALRHKLFTK